MNLLFEVRRLAGRGQGDEASRLLEDGVGRGDLPALLMLANWRLFGMYGPRDPAEAHRLLDRAVAKGSAEAVRLKASLLANGTGTTTDPAAALALLRGIAASDAMAARQVALLDAMPPPEKVRAYPASIASRDPAIWLVRGFASHAECDYLVEAARPALQPSFVVDPATGRPVPNPIRTSSGMNFDPAIEDPVVHAVNRRFAAATGSDVRCGELLNILRYEPGQEYRPHMDALPGAANQRVWTALLYLNDDYQGGETEFDLLGVKLKGQKGDALLFRNVGGDGQGDPRTRHAGTPVTGGIKWLASRWIRQSPYDPWQETGG